MALPLSQGMDTCGSTQDTVKCQKGKVVTGEEFDYFA